jgi:outer membrane protein assembly factor BamB
MARQAVNIIVIVSFTVLQATASDWTQFRGPNGQGISEERNLPLSWGEKKNLKWKTTLPGPGSSSPIVCGERVFVTCYSGYGIDRSNPGDQEDLKRHLLCLNCADGKILWDTAVEAVLPEDPYSGYISEHGYASSTPVTDGNGVYAFFGKTGVLAFDFDGNKLWQVSVGTESSNRRWGSAASPILYKDFVIVNASEESRSIRALDKATGKEIWKAEGDAMELAYGTPFMADIGDGLKELVLAMPFEVWALNPNTGKCNWYAQTDLDGNICPSIVGEDRIVYVFGGFRRTGSVAIRAGGGGNAAQRSALWATTDGSYVPSPVIHGGHLYWVSDLGYACCMDAKSGKMIYRERLSARGGGKPFYASVVLVDERLYAVSRTNGTFVLAAEQQFKQLAHNQFESDGSDFHGSPAISDGRIFLRSNRFLYCIQDME